MKKNNKGFTLVELLAVIVILGLLMAIAIPSVTKYITNSRKKTLATSVDSYITAVMTEVNDGGYLFSDGSTVFAVPIECVSLEKGGDNPFGNWMQANDNYWAYVLVQYDAENYNYVYGFTFKDDAGYGLYPTSSDKFNSSGYQIRNNLPGLDKPTTGVVSQITSVDNWLGFNVSNDTQLVVLEAESEGVQGNKKTTCTLQQKGDNYTDIESDKNKPKPCSANGTSIGSIITCGSEKFYIVDENEYAIKGFAALKINLTTVVDNNGPRQRTAHADTLYGGVHYDRVPEYFTIFATEKYWEKNNREEFVYSGYKGNNVYQYVEAYEDYLSRYLNVKSASASLIDRGTLVNNLGCTSNNCNNSPYSWVHTGYYWWTGTVPTGDTNIYCYNPSSGKLELGGANGYFDFAVRPVVTIAKSEIEF